MGQIPETRDRSQLRYWGFLSYSHRDKRIVRKLQRILESFQIPKEHIGKPCPASNGTIPQRLRPFFRDEDELPTSSNLQEPIQAALRDSKSLVVVCSLHSAASLYVDAEVLFYKQLSQDERLSCVIIEGKPNVSPSANTTDAEECFCPSLRYQLASDGTLSDFKAEPLGAAIENTSIEQEAVRVIASITGLPFGELWKRFERDRKRRKMYWLTGIFFVLAIISSLSYSAVRSRIEASYQKIRADQESVSRRAAQYKGLISLSEKEYARGEYKAARQILVSCTPELREWEWYFLNHMYNPAMQVLEFPEVRLETVDLSSDGKFVAAGTGDGRIVIWDRQTATVVHVLEHTKVPERIRKWGDVGGITCLRFSPDSSKLLTISAEGRLIIWDTTSFKVEKVLTDEQSNAICWLPDSTTIVRLAGAGLCVWDLETNALKKSMEGDIQGISSLDLSANGRLLAIADMTSHVGIWDTQTGRLVRDLNHNSGGVVSVAVQPSGEYVAGGTEQGAILIWRIEDGAEISRLKGHASYVNSLDWQTIKLGFERSEQRLVSCGEDETVRIWEPMNETLLNTLRGHEQPVKDVVWSISGDFAVSSSGDGTVRIWNPDTAGEVSTLPGRFIELKSMIATNDSLTASVKNPFPSRPNRPVGNIQLSRWDLGSHSEPRTYGDPRAGHAISLIQRESDLVGVGFYEDGRIHIWNTSTSVERVSDETMPGKPIGLAVSPDGDQLATCNREGSIWIWDIDTLQISARWKPVMGQITGMISQGTQLVTATSEGRLQFWNWKNGQLTAEIEAHEGAVLDLCGWAEGKIICSSGTDGQLILISTNDHQIQKQFSLWTGPAYSLAMHPAGKRFAAGHADGSISLWDLQGTLQLLLRAHSENVRHLQFTPAGMELFSASEDGIIRLWRAPKH